MLIVCIIKIMAVLLLKVVLQALLYYSKNLKIRTPEKSAVNILKLEQYHLTM